MKRVPKILFVGSSGESQDPLSGLFQTAGAEVLKEETRSIRDAIQEIGKGAFEAVFVCGRMENLGDEELTRLLQAAKAKAIPVLTDAEEIAKRNAVLSTHLRVLRTLLEERGEKSHEERIKHLLKVLVEELNVERAGYWTFETEPPSLLCRVFYSRTGRSFGGGDRVLKSDCPGYFAALAKGPLLVVDDVHRDERVEECRDRYLQAAGISSMVDVVLRVNGGEPAAVLCLAHAGPRRAWRTEEQEFALMIGQIVVGAISSEERHRMVEAAKERELRTRAVFDQTYEFIGTMTPEGILTEANLSALAVIGMKKSDVLGKLFWETPWWTHSAELQERLRSAVRTAAAGKFVRFEATHPTVGGGLRDVDFSLKPVKDEAGRVIMLIPEGRDITDVRTVERQRDELNKQ